MKIVIPLIILGWLCTMGGALAATQRRETPVQFHTSGVDAEYVHGEHCIDGRSF